MRSSHLKRELAGVALLLFAVFLAGALVFQRTVPPDACVAMRGPFGPVGGVLKCAVVWPLGLPAGALLVLLPVVQGLRLLERVEDRVDRRWLVLLGGLVVLLPVVLGLVLGRADGTHDARLGIWGQFTSYYLTQAFGTAGSWVIVTLALCALSAAALAWNPVRALLGSRPVPAPAQAAVFPVVEAGLEVASEPRRSRRGKRGTDALPAPEVLLIEPAPEEMPAFDATYAEAAERERDDATAPARRRQAKKSKETIAAERVEKIAAEIDAAEDGAVAHGTLVGEELPATELLSPPPPRNAESNRRELDLMAAQLKDALRTFAVEAEIVGRTVGPVVTQYEVEPAPGVKVRQIANLSNDLALRMRAQSIRIVAPIPGRGAVGVEVPNPNPEMVAFREIVESREFAAPSRALPIALGKDLAGKPVIADLARMPHLLIAGATGSGKSVCINTIITSLVYRHTPRTLRFLMVDPKMVELSVYNVLPHLRHKVITDNRDAAAVLKWAVVEMEERYKLLAANGCRNVQDFNRRVQDGVPLKVPKDPNVAFADDTYHAGVLPYIVVVIDELADLMMTVQGEVETPLAMLAQKARAIGLHLILATQRPSVNVITGLIKANFPSRIAFRVASQVDSRTIIDGIGAEALLGNGDMLFIPPGKSEPWRLQGAFISSEDTERLTQWYTDRKEARKAQFQAQGLIPEEPDQAESDILEDVRRREADAAAASGGEPADEPGDRDRLFREAAECCIQHQQGSTSLLQRRLNVGYGRAARIIDQLEQAGVLGESKGARGRDVLVGLEELDRICGTATI